MKFFIAIIIGVIATGFLLKERVKETEKKCNFNVDKASTNGKNRQRVIILGGSLIGAWYAGGGEAVAISSEMNEAVVPQSARSLPRVGSFAAPNMEKIFSLSPDLVILNRYKTKPAVLQLLRKAKIKCFAFEYITYHDFFKILKFISHLHGKGKSSLAEKLKKEIALIIKKHKKSKKQSFASIFFTGRSLFFESNEANVAAMASNLGAQNLFAIQKYAKQTRSLFNLEKLLAKNPDVIFITTMIPPDQGKQQIKKLLFSNSAWHDLKAVKNKRVYFLPQNLFLYKANERYPEAFKYLARKIYPAE